MSLDQLYVVLLIGAAVMLVGIVATRVASSIGLPSLLLYLLLGVLLGEDVIGIHFDSEQLTQDLGIAALAVILIEGGLTTRWGEIRASVLPASILATVGVGVSTLVTAGAAYLFVGTSWQLSLLLGAIVSSTDAAAVFAILRVLPLPRRVAGMLEAESGFNDAPTVILVTLFSETPLHLNVFSFVAVLVYELAAGAAMGGAVGWLGRVTMRRLALPSSGLYPIAVFGLGFVAFAAAGAIHASGFLAAYVAALVLANSGLPHRAATRSFAEGLGSLAQIGLFVLLGLLITPHEMGDAVLPAVVVGFALLVVARPLSVVCSLAWFRFPWREQLFLSWAGLRGAVPVVLATLPITAGVRGSHGLLNVVFILVAVFTLVQGPSLPPIAKLLNLLPREATRQVMVESAPLDVLDAELLTMTVPPGSALHSVSVLELRLPDQSVINLIIRDGRTFVPDPDTQLRTGDELLIVTTRDQRDQAERRLRAVSRRGPLAHWFDEFGAPD